MKHFLFRLIFCFFIIVVICTIPCYIFEKKVRECPYSIINSIGNMNHVDANLIILGNSRAERGYNTSILDTLTGKKCLNLGIHGYPFDFQYNIMYKRYLIHNNKPQYILLDIGPSVFFKHTINSYNLDLLPYVTQNDFKEYFNNCPEYKRVDRIMFVRYFGKLDLVIKQLNKFKKNVKRPNQDRTMMNDDKNDSSKMPLECDITIIHMLCGFLEECGRENVKVIMVCSPMHSNLGKMRYDMDNFWNIINYCISGKGVIVFNYQDLFNSDTSYFSDPMHLNNYGKDCFTIKLAHDLDSLGLLK